MEAVAALARMSISLVAVLGLIWLVTRWLRRTRAGAGGEVALLSRTAVGGKAGVALVRVGDRALVLGVTEQQVNLLSEVPLELVLPGDALEVEHTTIEIPAGGGQAGRAPAGAGAPAVSGATGSAIAPATWLQAMTVLRERTIRR